MNNETQSSNNKREMNNILREFRSVCLKLREIETHLTSCSKEIISGREDVPIEKVFSLGWGLQELKNQAHLLDNIAEYLFSQMNLNE